MKNFNLYKAGLVLLLFFINIEYLLFAENGVTKDFIVIGQSCVLTGPAYSVGVELQNGANAYFNNINNAGGIHGRKIQLISYDDGYEPKKCIENTHKLIETDSVFLLFNYTGTPTTYAILPILDETSIPLVGPFTGAEFLRETKGGKRNVINIRGTYDQEISALVNSFKNDLGLTKIAVFYQNDVFGEQGLESVEKALKSVGLNLLGSASYERNTAAVKKPLMKIQELEPDAVILIAAYEPCAAFIQIAKTLEFNAKFANISPASSLKFIQDVGTEGEGTYISQVMPHPSDITIPIVKECTDVLGKTPTYIELEGFLNAKILVECLKNAGQDLTRKSFIDGVHNLTNYDAGGLVVTYSNDDHQGLDKVYFTKIVDGATVSIEKLN